MPWPKLWKQFTLWNNYLLQIWRLGIPWSMHLQLTCVLRFFKDVTSSWILIKGGVDKLYLVNFISEYKLLLRFLTEPSQYFAKTLLNCLLPSHWEVSSNIWMLGKLIHTTGNTKWDYNMCWVELWMPCGLLLSTTTHMLTYNSNLVLGR